MQSDISRKVISAPGHTLAINDSPPLLPRSRYPRYPCFPQAAIHPFGTHWTLLLREIPRPAYPYSHFRDLRLSARSRRPGPRRSGRRWLWTGHGIRLKGDKFLLIMKCHVKNRENPKIAHEFTALALVNIEIPKMTLHIFYFSHWQHHQILKKKGALKLL